MYTPPLGPSRSLVQSAPAESRAYIQGWLAGANPRVVQRMLGHASAAMTLDVYADLFESDLDAVANRLENVLNLRSRDAQ